MKEVPKKTHTVDSKMDKHYWMKYKLPKEDGKLVDVCKTMFKSTFSLSDTAIANIRRKVRLGEIKDRRGEASIKDPILRKKRDLIERHLNSMEKIESHYSRETDEKVYLRPGLNMIKLYALYIEWFDDLDDVNPRHKASLDQYRHHFKTFNIGFKMWKKDWCDVCHSYEQKTGKVTEDEINEHRRRKQYARERKNQDKHICKQENLAICSAVFDLEKILVSPICKNSLIFYRRSYHSYNFTVFDYGTETASNYFWEEIHGGKGYKEVIGCLLKFVTSKISEGIKEFRFVSDNCAAQNKSRYLFAFYAWLAHHFDVTIRHTWLLKGHTQNEGDSVHAMIEKNKGDNDVFTPNDWFRIIKSAKKKDPVYKCFRMHFSDFKEVEKLMKAANFNGLPIKSLSEILIERGRPKVIKYKTEYRSEESWSEINLSRPSFDTAIRARELNNAYEDRKDLSNEKIADLRYLMKHHAIPPQHHEEYEQRINKSYNSFSNQY